MQFFFWTGRILSQAILDRSRRGNSSFLADWYAANEIGGVELTGEDLSSSDKTQEKERTVRVHSTLILVQSEAGFVFQHNGLNLDTGNPKCN